MKIAICIPHYGDVKARFLESLANAVAHTMAARINYRRVITQPMIWTSAIGSPSIDTNRNVLVQQALKWGADYILFCDSDMTFPGDALLKLLAADQPVVGCNYARRSGKGATAARDSSSGLCPIEAGSGLERVDYLGLGLCLINSQIFDSLKHPWFRTTIGENGKVEEGEDGFFFAALRRAGVPVFVHHDLSEEVGHLAERELRLSDLEGRSDVGSIRAPTGAQ